MVASLRRTLLVDALVETSWFDKPSHHVKVGFIEGVMYVYMYLFHCHKKCMIQYRLMPVVNHLYILGRRVALIQILVEHHNLLVRVKSFCLRDMIETIS